MQLDALQALIRMYVDRIIEEVFPDETGASRLQQVGLFTMIFMLQNTEGPVTATRIAGLLDQSDSQIHKNLQKLLKVGVVERTKIKNRLGKGQAWHLTIKESPQTEKLLKALGETKKSRPGNT